jgi:hypothetical protein
MAKDNEKYRYIEAAILRDSDTLASIEKDATEHHMTDHLGKLLAMRIADYYKLAERLGTYSVEGILAALSFGPGSSAQVSSNSTGSNGHSKQPTEVVEEDPTLQPSANVEENAAEASDFWSSL